MSGRHRFVFTREGTIVGSCAKRRVAQGICREVNRAAYAARAELRIKVVRGPWWHFKRWKLVAYDSDAAECPRFDETLGQAWRGYR